jgi:hypothetical protein
MMRPLEGETSCFELVPVGTQCLALGCDDSVTFSEQGLALGATHGAVIRSAAVATILLVGVDLFFRGKLDVLLAGHHLVTTDTIAEPELVVADISRVEPEEVADTFPDIPIVGFSSHTDTAGLRRAHAAGFDQVLAKSALQERGAEVIEELLAPVE